MKRVFVIVVPVVAMLVAVVAVAMLVVVAVDFVAGPYFAFSTRHWPPQRHRERLLGVIEGVVKRLDGPTGVIDVASGTLGFGALRLVVGPETTVTVGDKLGWLPNLDRGNFVRITYEVQTARLFAWRVDVVPGRAHASELAVRDLIAEVATATPASGTPVSSVTVAAPGEAAPTRATPAAGGETIEPRRVRPPAATRVRAAPARSQPARPSLARTAPARFPAPTTAVPPSPPSAARSPSPAGAGSPAPSPPETSVVVEPDLPFPPVMPPTIPRSSFSPSTENMPPAALPTPAGADRTGQRLGPVLERILVMPPPVARSREPTRVPQLP